MAFYALRITAGQEKIIADLLKNKAIKDKLEIYSILMLDNFKGYIIVEGENESAARKLAFQMPNVKGVLSGEVDGEEIVQLMEKKPPIYNVEKDDIVEVINGPFKGDRAKVIKIDLEKEESTIELLEAAIPIPITTKLSWLKIHKKAKEEED